MLLYYRDNRNHRPKSEGPGNRRRDGGQLVCSEEQGLVKGLGRSFDTFPEFNGVSFCLPSFFPLAWLLFTLSQLGQARRGSWYM